ncbi:hypothetical protein [Hyphomicrobium sp. DY-1]|uniref:hypothetical protein n=1 Tax=Hyphomicrobium sp. DY-1 TaxID=3075650 RepID=UPI0039C1AC5E
MAAILANQTPAGAFCTLPVSFYDLCVGAVFNGHVIDEWNRQAEADTKQRSGDSGEERRIHRSQIDKA